MFYCIIREFLSGTGVPGNNRMPRLTAAHATAAGRAHHI